MGEFKKILGILNHCKFFLIILLILAVAGYLFYLTTPPNGFPIDRIISIEEGESIKSTSLILKEEKIIRSSIYFQLLVQFSEAKSIMAGDYLFDKEMNIFEVVKKIETGTFDVPNIKITITEGMTVRDIATRLNGKLVNFNPQSFMKLATKYEGYLFPDTYQFNYNADEFKVIEAMRNNFNQKMLVIKNEIAESGKNLDDIITMASIVEKEATKDTIDEVTDVLWNRINKEMPLQVDATFVYSIGKHSFDVTKLEMQDENNPYNTYAHTGLPPTPISNPGLESIMASINHRPTDYVFFLTGRDGEMYFATTFEEHKRNRYLYLD